MVVDEWLDDPGTEHNNPVITSIPYRVTAIAVFIWLATLPRARHWPYTWRVWQRLSHRATNTLEATLRRAAA